MTDLDGISVPIGHAHFVHARAESFEAAGVFGSAPPQRVVGQALGVGNGLQVGVCNPQSVEPHPVEQQLDSNVRGSNGTATRDPGGT
ncbi:MAG: hypothetical protein AAF799_42230 [Myxococcota bacterium]